MALSAPGVGSNLDINGLVSQLLSFDRKPLEISQKRTATVQAQFSAYSRLQSQIAGFGDAAAALGKTEKLSLYRASLADTEVATVSATTSASSGTYALEVNQLAKAGKVATSAYTDSSTVVGTGSFTITLGTYDSVGNTFTANPAKTPVTITLNSGNNTLSGVRDAINNASAGVSASIVTDNNGARLVISSNEIGAKNTIKLSSSDIAGLVYDPTVLTAQPVSKLQTAQDAKIKIDGLEIVSSNNTISGALSGVTLNLTKEKPGVTTVLTVARDTDTIKQTVRDFVRSYNDLNTLVRASTSYNAATKQAGPLQGQQTALSVATDLRNTVTGAIPGTTGDFTRLSDIGISLQADGSLKIDETKLSAAANENLSKLTRLFQQAGSSPDTFVTRIKTAVDKAQGAEGLITAKTNGLTSTLTRLSKEQDDINRRLVSVEARYRKQFTALDTKLSSQNALSSYLTNQFNAQSKNS
ncbi:MAG: flagellar filament capping protein FliD [Betaproteobacteria bacterium]|nr:flagellar filament capping protein FliD [Betaproteobacteria bacterium]